eukprot:330136-Rhodomonas_salina.1
MTALASRASEQEEERAVVGRTVCRGRREEARAVAARASRRGYHVHRGRRERQRASTEEKLA